MADKEDKKTKAKAEGEPATASAATPRFDPKPVQLSGESILDRILPHIKKIVYVLVGVSVILAVVFFFVWLGERKQEKATDKLAAVLDVAERPVHAPEPPPPGPVDPKAKPPKDDAFPDVKTRANAVLDSIVKQDTEAAGPTFRASLLMQAGKVDEAITEYRRGQTLAGLDGVLAREGLGLALETKAMQEKDATARQKLLEDALAAFTAMQPDEAGPRRAFALYHQGRMFTLLGKREDAKTAFTKAKELGKDTDLPELIDERLASLGSS